MWKLNLGFGSLVVSVSGLIFSHNYCCLMFNFGKIQLILECKLHSSIDMICKKKKSKHCIYAYIKHAMSFSNFEACVGDKTNDTKLTTKPHLIPPTLPQRCNSLLNVKTKFKL